MFDWFYDSGLTILYPVIIILIMGRLSWCQDWLAATTGRSRKSRNQHPHRRGPWLACAAARVQLLAGAIAL
jgi:hypothetical protein